jgi:hypothetical protein
MRRKVSVSSSHSNFLFPPGIFDNRLASYSGLHPSSEWPILRIPSWDLAEGLTGRRTSSGVETPVPCRETVRPVICSYSH